MINHELIKQAEAVAIVDYLASKGIEPVKAIAKELVYYSPLRNDNNPSFFVNPVINKFKDFANDEHCGNIFRLVQLMEDCKFPQAVAKLLEFDGKPVEKYASLFLSATDTEPIKQQTIITDPVKNPVLINYLKERGIPYSLAKKYLYEVMNTAKDRVYFYVGFRNNSDGYALRNRSFKRCLGTQDITTFDLESRKTVAVFEGFFDFLSALVLFGLEVPRIPTVVLNSTNNRKKAIEYLREFEQVNCFFDRDKSGEECFRLLRDRDGLPVKDQSKMYEGYNDLNDFLTKTR
ncbi:MAG: toprim domain-containing protein [Spirosomataceae bacterium]